MQPIDANKAIELMMSGKVSAEDLCKVLNTIAKTEERLSDIKVNENSELSSLGRNQSMQ